MPGAVAQIAGGLKAEALPDIERVTVPICGVQDGKLKLDRTGVLYRVADQHFILTASHDFRDVLKHDILLCIPHSNGAEYPVPLCDAVFHGTEIDGRDVAAIRLDDSAAEEIRTFKSFLPHSKVDLSDGGGDGLYLAFGYPLAWASNARLSPKPLWYLSPLYAGKAPSPCGHDPNLHILLQFERNAVDAEDSTKHQLPEPKGLSGCGIWRVGDTTRDGMRWWSPREYRLVAIQHSWNRKAKYIKGTWIRRALGLVLSNYPELQRSMSLVYPRLRERLTTCCTEVR